MRDTKGHIERSKKKDGKYLCIFCKEEYDEIPSLQNNECITAYWHTFVDKKHLIRREP